MSTPYSRAPHQGSPAAVHAAAPNAALLIDFDNVTMGMRSDLSKDLQKLLQSDVIRGKVTVQRAYADWRRYPQYIVPLSENSIDLIFAPAYGTSKKNATDIRMAIDGMELVFTRPEIGTFILLTGDSDFSSLVLKLKEYGKYVIGVGIQESSSDILVQNCDEYYSYTTLAGLQKTSETDQKPVDPWLLVEQAVRKMQQRDDVMRSDRLKQVMIEIDASFSEGNFGFSKFSRFLTEAASKGLVRIRKLENGQYEVSAGASSGGSGAAERGGRSERGSRGRRQERGPEERESRTPRGEGHQPEKPAEPSSAPEESARREKGDDPLKEAYSLLTSSLERLLGDGREAVRDSDVKRKMLELDPDFDEAVLGFSKFSRFLHLADEQGVIRLVRKDGGNYEVAPGGKTDAPGAEAQTRQPETGSGEPAASEADGHGSGRTEAQPSPRGRDDQRLGPRRGSTRRRGGEEPPPLMEGQTVKVPGGSEGKSPAGDDVDPSLLGLPTDREAILRYLTNSYKGVGAKTAEALVDGFGVELFQVLQTEPNRIHEVVPSGRAETVLDAWHQDFERRRRAGTQRGGDRGGPGPGSHRTRRGGGRS